MRPSFSSAHSGSPTALQSDVFVHVLTQTRGVVGPFTSQTSPGCVQSASDVQAVAHQIWPPFGPGPFALSIISTWVHGAAQASTLATVLPAHAAAPPEEDVAPPEELEELDEVDELEGPPGAVVSVGVVDPLDVLGEDGGSLLEQPVTSATATAAWAPEGRSATSEARRRAMRGPPWVPFGRSSPRDRARSLLRSA